MNAYERRLVHIALRDNVNVETHSQGVDPDRHVVISVI
jgi:spoIIIJ-associated protein